MNPTMTLLDKYAAVCKHASDSATARALKVQPSAVNNWRHGRSHPDAESIERMCIATGESVAHWLPLIESERARSPEAKRVWLRLAQAAAVVVLAFGLDVQTAKASTHGADDFSQKSGRVYIMSNQCLPRIRVSSVAFVGDQHSLSHNQQILSPLEMMSRSGDSQP